MGHQYHLNKAIAFLVCSSVNLICQTFKELFGNSVWEEYTCKANSFAFDVKLHVTTSVLVHNVKAYKGVKVKLRIFLSLHFFRFHVHPASSMKKALL